MMRATSRITVLLLLGCVAARAQERNPFNQELLAGIRLFEEAKYEEATSHFAKARQLAPKDWRGHAWHAMTVVQLAYEERENPARRLALLAQGEGIAGELKRKAGLWFSDPLYQFIRGVILSARGDDTSAFKLLKRAASHPRHRYAPYESLGLATQTQIAYAKASVGMATRLIVHGEWESADVHLRIADRFLPADHPDRHHLERKMGVTSEYLGRLEEAVSHLRKCIALNPDRPEVRYELTASIAMIWFATEKLEQGKAELDTLPADCTHTEVLVAQTVYLYKLAMREPEDDVMDEALRKHRDVMALLKIEDRYRLVEQFAELVLEKVRPADVAREKDLLDETTAMVLREQKRRPECPGLYFSLYNLAKLRGDREKEVYYQKLHEQKKAEWESKEQYDHRGRPRCR